MSGFECLADLSIETMRCRPAAPAMSAFSAMPTSPLKI